MKVSIRGFSALMVILGLSASFGCAGEKAAVSAVIGPAGGEILIPGGASVRIPAGALLVEMEIEVREGGWPSGVDYAASPVWHFGPDGLMFLKPVEVTISVGREMDRNDLALFWSKEGRSIEYEIRREAYFDRVGGQITVTASTDHFSSGYVGSGNIEVCADRYEIEAGDIVWDTLTDLRWRREAGFLADNFGDSEAACQYMLGYGGYSDWRLPTVRELLGLVSGCGIQMEGCCMPGAFGECGTNAYQLRANYWTETVGEQENSHYAVDYSTCDWSYSSQPDGGMVSNQIASFHLCVAGESVACQPMCGSRECGPDPVCGISCGTCGNGYSCQQGECVEDECVQNCTGRECGPDPVCGISCGTCGNGASCQDGECVEDGCVQNCTDLDCGPDPICGQSCGTCDDGYSCQDGECVEDECIRNCAGLECGPDPVCGQSCGTCGYGYSCQDGECVEDECVPNCTGRQCGSDPICGQSCGTCDNGYSCESGECVSTNPMVFIPAGSFWMGCNSSVDTQCASDESPYHEVTLSGYYINKTEVTQVDYKKCVDSGHCTVPSCGWYPTSKRPVACVDWNQAMAYCAWEGNRLPTEAEWEKAARGTDGRKYPWGNKISCDNVVSEGCAWGDTLDVCSKSPAGDSPYGLCDMSGNVWEWVSDWYQKDYYADSPSSNPTGPVSGSARAGRGGSIYIHDRDEALRASDRDFFTPSTAVGWVGFRCAKDAP